MKKTIIYTAATLLLCAALMCSCTGIRTDIIDRSKEVSKPVDDIPDDEDNENEGNPSGEDYAKPATFSRLYTAVSDLRNDFYDTLSASLSEVSDDTQIFVDIYKAMAGESTFVCVSACGAANDEIVKKAISVSDCIDVSVNETENGWRIDLKAKTDVGYRSGGFDVVYDGEADAFYLDYSVEDGTFKRFYAKRAEKGYIAQYLDETGLYIRYILCDDKTGKMFVCDSGLWKSVLPDTEAEFEPEEFSELFELTGDKFHSVCNGVEDTYPEVRP